MTDPGRTGPPSPPDADSYERRLKELLALQEELQAQAQLLAAQSEETFQRASAAAATYAECLERASQALDPARLQMVNELVGALGDVAERSFRALSDTVGSLLAEEMWNPDAVVRWDEAIRRLAQHITGMLISALINFAIQQTVAALATKTATAANLAYAASIYKIAAAYAALASARAANRAIPGIGMVVHEGGYILHRGGPVRLHAGGLRADERPAILQTGEYVLRRESVRRLGLPFLDHLNRVGRPPSAAGSITFQIQAWDGADVERVVVRKIIPILERERAGNRLFAAERS